MSKTATHARWPRGRRSKGRGGRGAWGRPGTGKGPQDKVSCVHQRPKRGNAWRERNQPPGASPAAFGSDGMLPPRIFSNKSKPAPRSTAPDPSPQRPSINVERDQKRGALESRQTSGLRKAAQRAGAYALKCTRGRAGQEEAAGERYGARGPLGTKAGGTVCVDGRLFCEIGRPDPLNRASWGRGLAIDRSIEVWSD